MASKYILCGVLVVAFLATTVAAEKGKKGKMMGMLSCHTMESIKTMVETRNATIKACLAEFGFNTSATTETTGATTTRRPTTRERKQWKPNMCFIECLWRQSGLVKDGSFVIGDFAKASIKPEFQEKVVSNVNSCLTEEGLSTMYTVNKEDQCKSLEKYGKCLHKATKVCKADSSSSSEE